VVVGVIVVINLYMYFKMQNEKLNEIGDWSFVLVFLFFVSVSVPHDERYGTA